MSNPYYPPGNPIGIDHGAVEYRCPVCNETVEIGYEYDRSVNAFSLEDPPLNCFRCSHEIEDKELDNLEPVEPPEPDYDPDYY